MAQTVRAHTVSHTRPGFESHQFLYVYISGSKRLSFNRVPTRTGKSDKMGRHFPVREK